MSEGDVSLIRDEDVLRRMWQQTEDFSRKKEIRAHMYRLREERLRNLYSPEPSAEGKGVESSQTHVKSLLDQSFQGLKSKEVRDAGSPPKDFAYRGQDLKDLSNAGWNVESENRTTDDGHTHVKSVHANIEGRYDVDGGKGQFAAVDHHKQAVTEYQDDNTSLKRNESSSNTAAHEEVIRKTDNGTQFSSTTSSSTSSKFQQVSSTKHEVPYTKDDYNLSNTNRNEEIRHVTKSSDYEENLRRSDVQSGELVSRKVDYPDENTKVIVETRCLPDGTRVTSTRREFRVPAQSTRSEHHSSRNESRSYSTSSHQKVASDIKSSRNDREFDSRTNDIVDSQKHADDYDFTKNVVEYSNQKDDYVQQRTNQQVNESKRFETRDSSSKITRETTDKRNDVIDSRKCVDDSSINKKYIIDDSLQKDDYSTTERRVNQQRETKVNQTDRSEIITSSNVRSNQRIEHSTQQDDYSTSQRTNRFDTKVDETDRRQIITSDDNQNIQRDVKETRYVKDNEERTHNISRNKKIEEVIEKKTTSDQYQTTYQTDYTNRKISNDWSPSHQAWASTLRADTPTSTRPTTRASSPGSRTYQSSTSSLRSSVSPDKTYRKPPSRGASPSKSDRYSPSRTTSDRYSSTHSTHSVTETKTHKYTSPDRKPPVSPTRNYTSPDRKPQDGRPRSSQSPEKRYQDHRPDISPERKPGHKSSPTEDSPRTKSPSRPHNGTQRPYISPERKPGYQPSDRKPSPESDHPRTRSPERQFPLRQSQSPEKQPGYQMPVRKTPSDYSPSVSPTRSYPKDSSGSSPERKASYQPPLPTRASPEKKPTDKYPGRDSPSPDRKPGYMRPTASKPNTPRSTDYKSPDRKSPTKSQNPEERPPGKITNIKEDHYKFIDAETKMYTRTDREDVDYTKRVSTSPDRYGTPRDQNVSPTSHEDVPDYCRSESPSMRPTLRKGSRSPSPPKGPVTFTEDQIEKTESVVSNFTTTNDEHTDDITKKYRSPKRVSPAKDSPTEPSPIKYGTYDKKHQTEKVELSTTVTKDSKDIYNSLTRREKTPKNDATSPVKKSPRDSVSPTKPVDHSRETSPAKNRSYDKKQSTQEIKMETVTTKESKDVKYDSLTRREKTPANDLPSPTKKSPRDSVSPTKPVDSSKESSSNKKFPRDNVSPTKSFNYPREPTPTKHDRKNRTEQVEEITTITKDTQDIKYDSLTRRQKISKDTPEPSSTRKSPRDSISPSKHVDREPSPSKFGTYDKKHRTEEVEETTTIRNKEDIKYDSLTRREKIPTKVPDVPASPTKIRPRDSVSPVKSPTKDAKYKHTTDFISTERTTEEINKRTSTSDRPRQLVTPSSSPTRKPKTVDTAPSTGQSSPTTSVSGFVYFSSPKTEKTIVTDLDDEEFYSEINEQTTTFKRPDTLNVDRSSSPSKIPCRSPSPEKRTSPSKDSLPRKSSLKKPSTDFQSPTEKPPSSFRISPTDDEKVFSEHKIVKKDHPEESSDDLPSKSKPPFERRETYEERCRKILGMMEDDSNKTVKKETYVKESPTNLSSPSVSPCHSPDTKEQSAFKFVDKKAIIKTNVTDFISHEQEDIVKTNKKQHEDIIRTDRKSKTPTRETSPTKLQDIISRKTETKHDVTTKDTHEDITIKTVRESPDREVGYRKSKDNRIQDDKRSHTRASTSPEKKSPINKPQDTPRSSPSPDRISGYVKPTERQSSPINKTSSPEKIHSNKYPKDSSPSRSSVSPDRPGYMRTTEAATIQNESSTEYNQVTSTKKSVHRSPTRETRYKEHKDIQSSPTSEYPRTKDTFSKPSSSPETQRGTQLPKSTTDMKSVDKPKDSTRSSASPDRKPSYMKPTAATVTNYETARMTEEDSVSKTTHKSSDRETVYTRTTSPSRPRDSSPTIKPSKSPERQPITSLKTSPEKKPAEKSPTRSSSSPERKPGYMRPTTVTTTKYTTTSDTQEDELLRTMETKRTSSKTPHHTVDSPQNLKESKHSRTPSPTKVSSVTEDNTAFIQSEREQEILDRVQKSLRRLSPNRDQRSSSRERSPGKSTISLQALDVECKTDEVITEENLEITESQTKNKSDLSRIGKLKDDKQKDQKPASKTPSRNVSPAKKPTSAVPSRSAPEYPSKSRSISPKKPVSPTERPQSPQVPKTSGIKPREPIPSQLRKPTPSSTALPKTERITTDIKKTSGVIKQNSFTKTSVSKTITSKPTSPTKEPEVKRAPTPKGINKENVSPKKEDIKVTRIPSDITLKSKKSSPQRMKSKPEIQVNDVSPKAKPSTTTTKAQKTIKEPQTRLAPKPKSATALNMSVDDDDVIIDVEQAKSSRENSPDRICPTPVGFLEDVGTPRFPDEVSEPDDEFRRRTHHTIHEAESIVDDIVEICEDDELFVKRTEVDKVNESDECLLSVTDKVSKFTNKIDTVTKPKDTTTHFKDTERRVHSDFIDENLKSDECLLSVSEKVNKFAKGSRDVEDRSPSRRIVDEYDTETIYQDDYTKLSVNDKAHLFVETAESVKAPKTKPAQKIERPDLSNVDESLKSDDCLLSVSDKVNKFVKTAEQFLNENQEVEDKEKKVKEQYEKIMKNIVQDDVEETYDSEEKTITEHLKVTGTKTSEDKIPSFAKETTSSHTKLKDYASPNLKPTERTPTVKITALRSSEAVKKAKALFENIASTTQKTKDIKVTKLTDIGVMKKTPRNESSTVRHPSVEDGSPNITDESEIDAPHTPSSDRPTSSTPTRLHHSGRYDDKPRSSPTRLSTQSPEVPRTKSPMRHSVETTKTVLSRYPAAQAESPRQIRPEPEKDKSQDKVPKYEPKQPELESDKTREKVPSYQRPTKTSQIKEEKTIEETEVSSRRGSGKFGVELRRTSVERSTISSERRRSSTDHHQPCIEDIFDLDLLEQMLEKVVGYEQRRRIRAQIRVAKKKVESEHTDTTYTKTTRQTITKTKSPDRRTQTKSPERQPKSTPQKTLSPERKHTPSRTAPTEQTPKETKPLLNGHAKEPSNLSDKRQRPQSPEKPRSAPVKTKSPVRQQSPDKKTRTASPSKTPSKQKPSKFNEYASAYMKRVGLNETDKLKFTDVKTRKSDIDDRKLEQTKSKKSTAEDYQTVGQFEEKYETQTTSVSKTFTERTSSKDTIEIVEINGKRSPSPEKKRSPERRASPSERLYYRSPSPDFKRSKSDKKETIVRTVYETEPKVVKKETVVKTVYEDRPKIEKKETIIKTVYDIEKKIPAKPVQEEKPSWVTSRNLKKITTDTRTFSSKKIEPEKPKYRAASPSKVISKPLDVITSSYGPGPLDADGRPLFGIKALRNGASNYQVKGTVIRQEFHSRNGSEPEGTVSVTAYSTEPEDLEKLLQTQGEKPSRLHGLAAITTTKKFGGDTGTTLKEAHSKEERASLEQFTHSDKRITDSRVEDFETTSFDRRDSTRSIEYTTSEKREDRTTDRREDRISGTRSLDRRENTRATEARKEEKGKRERVERRDDKKTVRQSSVKSLTEKYIKSASDTSKTERSTYPKAGLILRTTTMKDNVSSDSSAHAGLGRTDSAHSLASMEDSTVVTTRTEQLGDGQRTTTTTTTTRKGQRQERSFLDSSTKVTGVQDILTRMKNADIVIQEGDTMEDTEARALLNKFLGATVLMAGMQGYVTEKPTGKVVIKQETVRSSTGSGGTSTSKTSRTEHLDIDLDQCWDERVLRKLLEESTDYEQRRRLRARIRTLMAEQEACASAVTDALAAAGEAPDTPEANEAREEEEVTVTSSVRRNSSEKTVSSSTTTKTSKVIESMTRPGPKPVSPFAKFRQLEKQNSTNTPNSPKTPQSPGSPAQPYFKFTDPALQASALTIKERLLQWCRDKTRDYENVKLENFSTSWADGLAFCALLHHFLPDAFDYSKLTPEKRRHNFTLAFKVADEKAGIYPLLDVDDMVAMRKPDWKCVFTYVQSIHRRFKDQP